MVDFKRRNRRTFLQGVASGLAMTGNLPTPTARAANGDQQRLAQCVMPPEDAPHERTLMQWPVEVDVYGASRLQKTQRTIADIANAIAEFEPVAMMMGEKHNQQARQLLSRSVEIWDIDTNDLWCRDSGPTFVKNRGGELAVAHIQFNGWGEKQINNHDAQIAARVAQRLGLPLLATGLVGEQGAVEHDGAGTLLAHASCWANPNRSSDSEGVIGGRLKLALGAQTLIWAPGLKGHDITDYHIDALARFVAPGKVLIQLPEERDESEPYARAAYQTYDILKSAQDAKGRKLDVIVLPDPVNIRSARDDFVSSYVNYYVCNGAVLMAQFGDAKADARAKEMIQEFYPTREIFTLNVDPLGEAGGGIHCATQQQPKAG